jgi:CRP/FNR family cyclic AMP-dependent transcriptional regulator
LDRPDKPPGSGPPRLASLARRRAEPEATSSGRCSKLTVWISHETDPGTALTDAVRLALRLDALLPELGECLVELPLLAAERECRTECAVAGLPAETLGRVPLFEELDAAELQSIADSMHEANVPAGATASAEGGPGDGFFVIESGEAEVTVEGKPRTRMTAGDYFGEIALLLGSNRTATVTASTDLRCYALTPWDFRTLVEGSPSIAWKVMQSMAARLA